VQVGEVDAAPAEERVEQRLLPQLACGGSWFFDRQVAKRRSWLPFRLVSLVFNMIEFGGGRDRLVLQDALIRRKERRKGLRNRKTVFISSSRQWGFCPIVLSFSRRRNSPETIAIVVLLIRSFPIV
jgi:hypothetical protein